MNRIVITADITKYDGTVIKIGDTGKAFGFNRDTCNFSVTMDDGTYALIKAWEFDFVKENA